jgi:XTP/dITP diphosphohydrolase
MVHLLIATRNAHKTAEFAKILGPDFAVSDLRPMSDFPETEETGSTFEENATLKAIAASLVSPQLVVADDSGLEVAALAGAPGIYSARYSGASATDQENVAKLLAELRRMRTNSTPAARFCCVLVLAHHGKKLGAFTGTVEGAIVGAPRGSDGFGYDPVFVPSGFDRTFAELGDELKNRISHRANAIAKLRSLLLVERCRES